MKRGKIVTHYSMPEGLIELPLLNESSIRDLYEQIRRIQEIASNIHYHSCFISYSSADQVFADLLFKDLRTRGVRCWFAPEDLKIGTKIRPTLHNAIANHDKLLLVLSSNSVGSDWVQDEVERALNIEREEGREMLFPICIEPKIMSGRSGWPLTIRQSRYIGDFSGWREPRSYQHALERLFRDLRTEQ